MKKTVSKEAILCNVLIAVLIVAKSVHAENVVESLLNKYRDYSTLSSMMTDPEQYGVNITTWQIPHSGFCKDIKNKYKAKNRLLMGRGLR